jgi:hypothetical protein
MEIMRGRNQLFLVKYEQVINKLRCIKKYSQVPIIGHPITRKSRYSDTFEFGYWILTYNLSRNLLPITQPTTYTTYHATYFGRALISGPNIRILVVCISKSGYSLKLSFDNRTCQVIRLWLYTTRLEGNALAAKWFYNDKVSA